ncbi:HNH endonuclease [Duganella sp. FT135W]|uniref:HNH endonuclease n=1 Tax=Duganella flavida TaxID=2692175 RepID=A0A6L8KE78_9BURK|nr:HNH endonuclease signature motif containing protein [Duganella flavida]MYM25769.1 HNH endonuclease [Duganella flavida]
MARLQTLKSRLTSPPNRLATIQPGSWRNDKQSSTARGYGYKWQQARAGYLAKQPYCVYCAREAGILALPGTDEFLAQCIRRGAGQASVVDHIIAHRGDMKLFWDSTNWQSLCAPHHSRDKQLEESRGY